MAFWALVTGAIHLDGLADSADGLGGRDRAQRLAIMRDPHIGSYGAIALVLLIVLKVGLVAGVLARGHHLWLLRHSGDRPRGIGQPERGAAVRARRGHRCRARARRPSPRAPRRGSATAIVAALACARLRGVLALAAAALVVLVVGRIAQRRIGGVTGDVLGAAIELAECAALVGLLAGR